MRKMSIPIKSGYDGDGVCIIIGKKGKIASGLGLCWEEVGVVGEVSQKPCSACHSTHSNPVINRNGADEVETKMRSEGRQSRAGLIIME